MSRAEVRCLIGGFAVMCLAIDLTTHGADRRDALRLFIPIWIALAWAWGVRRYFAGRPKTN